MRPRPVPDVPRRSRNEDVRDEVRMRMPRRDASPPRGPQIREQAPVEPASRVRVPAVPGDDAAVLAAAEHALNAEVRVRRPLRVAIVRIEGWFSRRWFQFVGKVLGALRVTSPQLVVPPFVPGRVLGETHLRWDAASATYVADRDARPLHVEQRSVDNRDRDLAQGGASRVVLWLGASPLDGRAAAMLYGVGPPSADGWYASLETSGGTCRVDFSRPPTPAEMRSLMALDVAR